MDSNYSYTRLASFSSISEKYQGYKSRGTKVNIPEVEGGLHLCIISNMKLFSLFPPLP